MQFLCHFLDSFNKVELASFSSSLIRSGTLGLGAGWRQLSPALSAGSELTLLYGYRIGASVLSCFLSFSLSPPLLIYTSVSCFLALLPPSFGLLVESLEATKTSYGACSLPRTLHSTHTVNQRTSRSLTPTHFLHRGGKTQTGWEE